MSPRGAAVMKHKPKNLYLLCICLLFVLMLGGCAARTTEPTLPPATEEPEPTPEPTPTPAPDVVLGERTCDPDTRDLLIFSEEEYRDILEKAPLFPELESIRLNCGLGTVERVTELRERYPALQLYYNLTLKDELVPWLTEQLDLSALDPEELPEAAAILPLLPRLRTVQLPESFTFEDYKTLKDIAPQADFDYAFTLYKQKLDTHTESVHFRKAAIGEEGLAEIEAMLPYLENLKELRFEYCGLDDETMDQFRSRHPERDIVWRVESLPGGGQWTDAISLWIIGGYDDERLAPLKYCTKVKYLDIGHNGIENLDFLYYMPDLEVLIVENDHVSDITAIGSCTNLEYLEVGETHVTDISPLANCVNLVHLNIGRLHELTDISPLYGLTKLERVYGKCDENVPPEQVEHLKELLPDCEIRFEFDPGGPIFGSWRYYPGGGMVPRYKLLHDQIGYNW